MHINTVSGGYVAQPLAEHAKRIADLLQLFMAKGLVQRDGDTVVVRTIVVPPDELTTASTLMTSGWAPRRAAARGETTLPPAGQSRG